MNHFHQISLKLQLGIDPAQEIEPLKLREMWDRRCQKKLEEQLLLHKMSHPTEKQA